MRRRSRTQRVLKWVGTLLCLPILAVWVASVRWTCVWNTVVPYGRQGVPAIRQFGVERGCFKWWLNSGHGGRIGQSWRYLGRRITREPVVWTPDSWNEMSTLGVRGLFVPLWIPLAIVAVPTAFLWWFDRHRIRPGHCPKCGYNLTGNVSGICPECGTPVKREGKPA
jgi:hypothetical protein